MEEVPTIKSSSSKRKRTESDQPNPKSNLISLPQVLEIIEAIRQNFNQFCIIVQQYNDLESSKDQKNKLINLIEKYRDLIEDKDIDDNTKKKIDDYSYYVNNIIENVNSIENLESIYYNFKLIVEEISSTINNYNSGLNPDFKLIKNLLKKYSEYLNTIYSTTSLKTETLMRIAKSIDNFKIKKENNNDQNDEDNIIKQEKIKIKIEDENEEEIYGNHLFNNDLNNNDAEESFGKNLDNVMFIFLRDEIETVEKNISLITDPFVKNIFKFIISYFKLEESIYTVEEFIDSFMNSINFEDLKLNNNDSDLIIIIKNYYNYLKNDYDKKFINSIEIELKDLTDGMKEIKNDIKLFVDKFSKNELIIIYENEREIYLKAQKNLRLIVNTDIGVFYNYWENYITSLINNIDDPNPDEFNKLKNSNEHRLSSILFIKTKDYLKKTIEIQSYIDSINAYTRLIDIINEKDSKKHPFRSLVPFITDLNNILIAYDKTFFPIFQGIDKRIFTTSISETIYKDSFINKRNTINNGFEFFLDKTIDIKIKLFKIPIKQYFNQNFITLIMELKLKIGKWCETIKEKFVDSFQNGITKNYLEYTNSYENTIIKINDSNKFYQQLFAEQSKIDLNIIPLNKKIIKGESLLSIFIQYNIEKNKTINEKKKLHQNYDIYHKFILSQSREFIDIFKRCLLNIINDNFFIIDTGKNVLYFKNNPNKKNPLINNLQLLFSNFYRQDNIFLNDFYNRLNTLNELYNKEENFQPLNIISFIETIYQNFNLESFIINKKDNKIHIQNYLKIYNQFDKIPIEILNFYIVSFYFNDETLQKNSILFKDYYNNLLKIFNEDQKLIKQTDNYSKMLNNIKIIQYIYFDIDNYFINLLNETNFETSWNDFLLIYKNLLNFNDVFKEIKRYSNQIKNPIIEKIDITDKFLIDKTQIEKNNELFNLLGKSTTLLTLNSRVFELSTNSHKELFDFDDIEDIDSNNNANELKNFDVTKSRYSEKYSTIKNISNEYGQEFEDFLKETYNSFIDLLKFKINKRYKQNINNGLELLNKFVSLINHYLSYLKEVESIVKYKQIIIDIGEKQFLNKQFKQSYELLNDQLNKEEVEIYKNNERMISFIDKTETELSKDYSKEDILSDLNYFKPSSKNFLNLKEKIDKLNKDVEQYNEIQSKKYSQQFQEINLKIKEIGKKNDNINNLSNESDQRNNDINDLINLMNLFKSKDILKPKFDEINSLLKQLIEYQKKIKELKDLKSILDNYNIELSSISDQLFRNINVIETIETEINILNENEYQNLKKLIDNLLFRYNQSYIIFDNNQYQLNYKEILKRKDQIYNNITNFLNNIIKEKLNEYTNFIILLNNYIGKLEESFLTLKETEKIKGISNLNYDYNNCFVEKNNLIELKTFLKLWKEDNKIVNFGITDIQNPELKISYIVSYKDSFNKINLTNKLIEDFFKKGKERINIISLIQQWYLEVDTFQQDIINKRSIIDDKIIENKSNEIYIDQYSQLETLFIESGEFFKNSKDQYKRIKKELKDNFEFLQTTYNQINDIENQIGNYKMNFQNLCNAELSLLNQIKAPSSALKSKIIQFNSNFELSKKFDFNILKSRFDNIYIQDRDYFILKYREINTLKENYDRQLSKMKQSLTDKDKDILDKISEFEQIFERYQRNNLLESSPSSNLIDLLTYIDIYTQIDKKEIEKKFNEIKLMIKASKIASLTDTDFYNKEKLFLDNIQDKLNQAQNQIEDYSDLKDLNKDRKNYISNFLSKLISFEEFLKLQNKKIKTLLTLIERITNFQSSDPSTKSLPIPEKLILYTSDYNNEIKSFKNDLNKSDDENASNYNNEKLEPKIIQINQSFKNDSTTFFQLIQKYINDIKDILPQDDPFILNLKFEDNNDIDEFFYKYNKKEQVNRLKTVLENFNEKEYKKLKEESKTKSLIITKNEILLSRINYKISKAQSIYNDINDLIQKIKKIQLIDLSKIREQNTLYNKIKTIQEKKDTVFYKKPKEKISFDGLLSIIQDKLNTLINIKTLIEEFKTETLKNLENDEKIINELNLIKVTWDNDMEEIKRLINELFLLINNIEKTNKEFKKQFIFNYDDTKIGYYFVIGYELIDSYLFLPIYLIFKIKPNHKLKAKYQINLNEKRIIKRFSTKDFDKFNIITSASDLIENKDLQGMQKDINPSYQEFIRDLLENYFNNLKYPESLPNDLIKYIIKTYNEKSKLAVSKQNKYNKNDLSKRKLIVFKNIVNKKILIDPNNLDSIPILNQLIIVYLIYQNQYFDQNNISLYGHYSFTLIEYLFNLSENSNILIKEQIYNPNTNPLTLKDELVNFQYFYPLFFLSSDNEYLYLTYEFLKPYEGDVNEGEININKENFKFILTEDRITKLEDSIKLFDITFIKKFIIDRYNILWINIDGIYEPKSFQQISLPNILDFEKIKYVCYVRK